MGFIEDEDFKFPDEITDEHLEFVYDGLLLNSPRAISRFYFLYDDCFFSNAMLDNVYRSILFREGDEFSSELARKDFKLPKTMDEDYEFKSYKFYSDEYMHYLSKIKDSKGNDITSETSKAGTIKYTITDSHFNIDQDTGALNAKVGTGIGEYSVTVTATVTPGTHYGYDPLTAEYTAKVKVTATVVAP